MRVAIIAMVMSACVFGEIARADYGLLQLDVDGETVQGTPLLLNKKQVTLLKRDGSLFEFSPSKAENYKRIASSFQGYSQSELRGQLQREFGRGYEVSGAGNYLVVHPSGQRDQWAGRFEELYRSFTHYFGARGIIPQQPQFPLVAVVLPSRSVFQRYAAATGDTVSSGVLGYYSPRTNRIIMYDMGSGQSSQNWQMNAETIIHEAAHQTAFNVGIHNRYAPQPRWLVEGLGTLFEAPGVWDSRRYPRIEDRINKYRLRAYRKYVSGRASAGEFAKLIGDDRLFSTDPEAAYALSWVWTFFLVENEPRKYAELLRITAARKDFEFYTGAERLRDFTAIFGDNLNLLDARMQRFVQRLP